MIERKETNINKVQSFLLQIINIYIINKYYKCILYTLFEGQVNFIQHHVELSIIIICMTIV